MSARSRFEAGVRRFYSRADTETFEVTDTSLEFTGLFELVETAPGEAVDGIRQYEVAEISFLVADFAPSQIKDGSLIRRPQDGTYWKVDGSPTDDGVAAEAIFKVTKSRRSRTGAV